MIFEGNILTGSSGCSGHVVIPAHVVQVNQKCFEEDKDAITAISFEKQSLCTTIQYAGFQGLPALKIADLRYAKSLTSIPDRCFLSCSSLEKCMLPDDGVITVFGYLAFSNCVSLSFINFPYSLETISGWVPEQGGVFSQCIKLKTVHVSTSSRLKYLGGHCFFNSGITSFVVPRTLVDYRESPFLETYSLTSFSFEDGNENFYIENDLIYSKDQKTLIAAFPTIKGNVTIKPTVTALGTETFRGCRSVTGITIPSTITVIPGVFAQSCSSLLYVYIPDSVTYLGGDCFSSCRSLTRVVIKGNPNVGNFPFGNSKFDCGFDITNEFNAKLVTYGNTVGRLQCPAQTLFPRTPRPSRCNTMGQNKFVTLKLYNTLVTVLLFPS